jgi:hypothetical protein
MFVSAKRRLAVAYDPGGISSIGSVSVAGGMTAL